ncbi:MAG: alkaline phosphatase [Gammaproteobacteria bacterium]|nr:alkaline phosphatase [Gammaproteobacteria bacterium]
MRPAAALTLLCAALLSATAAADPWFAAGQASLKSALARQANTKKAKNIIFFLGDGMSLATVNAARVLEGQRAGGTGEENRLFFETFPYTGLIKTYNTDAMVPDSAGTMSALMTGVKTKAGVLSLDDGARIGHCDGPEAHKVATFLERAEQAGKATGIISTARLTHATPGATYAHSADRDWEADDTLPEAAKAKGCTDIARQFVEFSLGDGIELAFGGGRGKFLPEAVNDPENPKKSGERKDGRNLIAEWRAKHPAGRYVMDAKGFAALKAGDKPVLGLFDPSHMDYEADRAEDKAGEPSLSEMTAKAIALLQGDKDGFFLMVEGGRIDHAHHAGNARRALEETIEFAKAVQAARAATSAEDTLIVVTADHGHTLGFGGAYPRRGNPVLGLVEEGRGKAKPVTDLNGLPIAVLNYTNGPGVGELDGEPHTGGRVDLGKRDTAALNHRQEALIPLKSETHSAEDVPVYADGPWAQLFTGSLEQNVLFHLMLHAAGMRP